MKINLSKFEIIVGILATISTGLWTYYIVQIERVHVPKVKLEYVVNCSKYDDDSYIVSNKFLVKNTGNVLVELNYAQTRIKQISPKFKDLPVGVDEFNMLKSDDPRLLWPMIGMREWEDKGEALYVEPGETMELDSDFIILKRAQVIRLYGFVSNDPKRVIGRSQMTTFKVSSECATQAF